jgi:hypothetical protein
MGRYPVLATVYWNDYDEKGISYHLIYANDFAHAGSIIDKHHRETAYQVSFTFLEEGLVDLPKEIYDEIEKRGI